MTFLRRIRVAETAAGSESGYTGPLTLGLLIGIVIAGAIIIASGIGFLVLCLSRRRAARRRRYIDETSGEDTDTVTTAPRTTPRKLQKRDTATDKILAASPVRVSSPKLSSARDTPAPVLPPICTNHISLNPFRGSWSKPAPTLTQKLRPSWIDEDALHGPKVTKPDESRRKTIRDSWPLRNMVPTLPRLGAVNNQQDTQQHLQEQGRPTTPGFGQIMPVKDQIHHISPRSVPQLTKSIMVVKTRQPLRNAVSNVGQVYITNDLQRLNSSLNISPSRNTTRLASTDSTLSDILRSTEKRLQEGSSTGVAQRNKATTNTTAPKKSGSPAEVSAGAKSPIKTPTNTPIRTPTRHHTRSQSGTSILGKTQPTTPSHTRDPSAASLVSKPDSEYGEQEPTPVAEGLTSPNRQLPTCARSYSMSSSPSSSLSTLYSMDETQEGTTMVTTPPNSSLPDINKMPKVRAGVSANDPFVTISPAATSPAATSKSGSSGKQAWQLNRAPKQRSTEVLQKPPRPNKPSLGEEATSMPKSHDSASVSPPSQASLILDSETSFNANGPVIHPSGLCSQSQPRSGSLDNIDTPTPSLREALEKYRLYGLQVSPSKPCLIVTSPSDTSSIRTPASGFSSRAALQRHARLQSTPTPIRIVPTSRTLQDMESPSALGHQRLNSLDIPTLPPLPDGAKSEAGDSDDSPSPTPKSHQRRNGRARITSASSSVYSQDVKDDLAKLTAEINAASFQLNLIADTPPLPQSPIYQSPVMRSSPKPLDRSGSARPGIGETIAELRRMNSALSTYSTGGSSLYAADGDGPKLPIQQGGEPGLSHKRCGSKYYLAVGSPPKKSPLGDATATKSPPRRQGSANSGGLTRRGTDASTKLPSPESGRPSEISAGTTVDGPVMELKIPKLEFTLGTGDKKIMGLREGSGGNRATPPKHPRLRVDGDERNGKRLSKRVSTESLGLYDKDGFLISSPIRVSSPVKDSESPKLRSALRA